MRNRIIFIANFVVVFFPIGCNSTLDDAQISQHLESKEQKVTNQGQKSHVDAQGLPEYASAISSGLTELNRVVIPLGQVEILSKVSEGIERADADAKKYKQQIMDKHFRTAEKLGLVTIKEIEQSQIDLAGRGWNRLYTFTASQKAKELANPKKSDADFISIDLGMCTVIKTVKEEPYKHPELPSSDDYLLCVGVHKFEPTQFGRAFFEALGAPLVEEYKFRALIKVNPFINSYSYLISDWGYVDKDGWETEYIK